MHNDEETRLRNQAIWDTAVDAIITIDTQGQIVAYNPAAQTLFGFSRDEAVGRNVSILMPEAHRLAHDSYLQHYQHQPITGQQSAVIGHSRTLEGRHKDGHIFPIRLSLSEMSISGQCQFTAIIQDISELKNAEATLRESEQRLHFSQDFAGIGSWDWNLQTDELYWSEQIPPLFGYPKGKLETSYENFISAVHLDDRLAVEDAVTACICRDIPYDIEHRVVWPDNSVHWLHERGHVVRDGQGKPLRMLGVISNITESKLTQLALAESEARFRDIAESMSDWIWEVDAQGVYTYCAGHVKDIMGYHPEEIVGRTPFDLMPPDEVEIVSAVFADIVKYRYPIKNLENWNLTKDGRRVCLLTNGVPMFNATGELIGYRGIDTDITQRKQVEAALIEAKESAEQANRAKSEFLSSMSHELRTPLNAILGFTQLFGFDENLTKDQKMNLHEISRAGEHLLELVNEVLDLAKVESGHMELNMLPLPVADVLEECHAISLSLAEEHTVTLDFDTKSSVTVLADRVRLKQVLLNLISNGIKYNRPGGLVSVKIGDGNLGQLRMTVSDTGRGIKPDRLGELFQPFSRLGFGHSNIEGTGIGLVITKSLVEAMGGCIGVDSTPGEGSDFWLELPAIKAPDPAGKTVENLSAPPNGDESAPCHDTHKRIDGILAVEDNPTNRVLLRKQLQSLHYEVDIAGDGIEALEMLAQKSYRILLTDCNMPHLNGPHLTEIIRQQEHGQERHLPIMAITANALAGEAERCLQAGMDDYLAKPVELDQLHAKIKKYWTSTPPDLQPLFAVSDKSREKQPTLDLSVLQESLGEKIENHRSVLSIFLQSTPANVDEIQQALTRQDRVALQATAHRLKSAARAVGARPLATLCQLLEAGCYQDNWDKAGKLVSQITEIITQVEAAIADYMHENGPGMPPGAV